MAVQGPFKPPSTLYWMSTLSLSVSALSGAMFAACWWIIVHGDVWARYYTGADAKLAWWHYLAPLITSFGILLVNMVSASVIESNDDGFWGGSENSSKRPMLFTFMAVMLAGVGMAVWIGAAWYFNVDGISSIYPGQTLVGGTAGLAATYTRAIFLDFLIFFCSGLIFKFARTHDNDDNGF